MSVPQAQAGFAQIGPAKIYYEIAGQGDPFVMLHAGVADSRQWDHEFAHFAGRCRVLRCDLRGYGQSEPVEGEFSHLGDLTALLDHLGLRQPLVLMGCSMGGGLAMNFALAYPMRARALIMVGSAPVGLELDVPTPPKFAEAEKAYDARDWDLLCELETQIWFDGARPPDKVNPAARRLAYDMNHQAISHEAKGLGKRLPDLQPPAAERLSELALPVLVIVGEHDTPYILAAADFMTARLPTARKVVIPDAAHLPNLDHPAEFQRVVWDFLDTLPGANVS
jgi:pimeloyl-ACP methyl ester carboxylesterase